MPKTRVLITGGAGFIGSHTADALSKDGFSIRILDHLTKPVHQKRPEYLSKRYEFLRGDVTKVSSWLKALAGVDVVYHLAAYQDYLPDFSKFFHVNTVGTALLYELIHEKQLSVKKVIYASSQAVYGEGKYRCSHTGEIFSPPQRSLDALEKKEWNHPCICGRENPEFLAFREHDLPKPHNAYGMSKVAAESAALNFGKRYKIPTVAMRYSIVQGPRQSPHNAYSGALRIFVMQALAGKPLTVYEDGRQLRDFVDIRDVVEANLLVLKRPEADYQTFNVGGGRAYSVLGFAEMVREIVNPNAAIKVTGEFRLGDTRHAVSDITKLSSLGWHPQFTPQESIREYAEWLKHAFPRLPNTPKTAYEEMRKRGVLR